MNTTHTLGQSLSLCSETSVQFKSLSKSPGTCTAKYASPTQIVVHNTPLYDAAEERQNPIHMGKLPCYVLLTEGAREDLHQFASFQK